MNISINELRDLCALDVAELSGDDAAAFAVKLITEQESIV